MNEYPRGKGTSYWSIRRRVRRTLAQNVLESEDEETFEQNSCSLQIGPAVSADSYIDEPCSSEVEQIISDEESVLSRRSTDNEESDICHAQAENSNEFEMHCGLRHVWSDSSDSNADRESDNESDEALKNYLRDWAVKHQIPNVSLSDLLKILRHFHPDLPKDPRTLLKTKMNYTIQTKCGGEYYYFGIALSLCHVLNQSTNVIPDQFSLKLQINIDGLPLFKSTSDQFWPILGQIQNIEGNNKIFIICLFYGTKKPNNLEEYLYDFITEYMEIERNGIEFSGKQLNVTIDSIICDAPARAFIKNVKSYSGYHGCEKCTQRGRWMGKMTFPEINAPLRTDQSFSQQYDDDHHLGDSPLSRTSIRMVTQIPLDYMHLVCLGVMKRLLLLWIKGPLHCRLGSHEVQQISESLVALKHCIPSEFARKPRPLAEIERWKATEFRQFLLYTGVVALYDAVHPNIYHNFLLFSVGIHILLNERLSNEYNQYAHDLLRTFVTHFYQVYGDEMAVYNVHCLVHLADEARTFGSLDNISAFPFENFLSKLKKMVRKPTFPLAQIIRRLSEQTDLQKEQKTYPHLSKPHSSGPVHERLVHGCQYQKVETVRYVFKTNFKDSCVRIDGKICLIKNIILHEGKIFLVHQVFGTSENAFVCPLESKLLGILKVSNLGNTFHFSELNDVESKCVILPFKNKYIAISFTDADWSLTTNGYAVVEFTEEKEVDVVPMRWLAENETMCQWPTFRMTAKIRKAVKANIAPNAEFRPLPVRVLAKTTEYNDARKKLSKATYTSDLQTDAEENEDIGSRKTKKPSRFESSDSEEVECDKQQDEEHHRQQIRKSPRKIQRKIAPPNLPSLPAPPCQPSSSKPTKTKAPTNCTASLFDKGPSTSASEKKIVNCLEKIMTNVEELKVQMHLNTQLLQATISKVDGLGGLPISGGNELDTELDVCFPLKSQEDIDKLEDTLQDKDKCKTLVKSLSTIGGENAKTTIRRLLSHMISNPLAIKINWMGKGGKIPFSSLKLKEILKETVRKNRLCSNTTDTEIFTIAKDWFRFASDRDGGRKKRAEKRRQQIANQNTQDDQTESEPEHA